MVQGNKQTIVIAPLDWGLGHATRIIPIIHWLKDYYNVVVAVPRQLHFLFDSIDNELINAPGYNIKYYRFCPQTALFFQFPKIIFVAIRTRLFVRKIIRTHQPVLLISDNRPFFFHRKAKSVYITHQLHIQHPNSFIKTLINTIHRRYIKNFDECWIPDTENSFFAGNLSKRVNNIRSVYIGALSRFMLPKIKEATISAFENACILSGPEPMRSRWMNQMIEVWKDLPGSIIIGAKHIHGIQKISSNLTVVGHIPDVDFQTILTDAKIIVARSGYTTIMDLLWLGKTAFLIPTPSQYEQEYLADFHHQKAFKRIDMNETVGLTAFCNENQDSDDTKFCSRELIIYAVLKILNEG